MKLYLDVGSLEVCARRRLLDILPYQQYLLEQGHLLVEAPELADQYMLFTCAFNQSQEERSLAQIEELQAKWGDRLVVAGCLTEIYPEKIAWRFDGPVLTNTSLRSIPYPKGGEKDIPVCRGCLGRCTYCVDRTAVGPLSSRPLEECLADLSLGIEKGLCSFRLVGDDLGAWGQDFGSDLYTLLEAMVSVASPTPGVDFHLHLLEINPRWLLNKMERLIAFSNPRIASLQVGIQSGSDATLARMTRDYDAAQACELVIRLRDYGKRVGGHFIVGFPGETQADFEASLVFIERSALDYGFIFLYSDMDGAPAVGFYPKVQDKETRLEATGEFLQQMGYRVRLTKMDKLIFTKQTASF